MANEPDRLAPAVQSSVAAQAIAEAQLDIQVDAMKAELTKLGGADSITVEAGEIGTQAVDISKIEYIPLYNTLDGRRAFVLPSMLRGKLGLIWREEHQVPQSLVGQNVWRAVPVDVGEHGPGLLCWLHEDSPMREKANKLGIPHVCVKANIPNEFILQQHMEIKHKKVFKVFDQAVERELQAEARDDQKGYMESLQTLIKQGNAVDPELIAAIVVAVSKAEAQATEPVPIQPLKEPTDG